MPTYIMLSTLTGDGARTLRKKPERITQVNREVEEMGAKIVGQYATLGRFDFVNIIEAENEEVAAQVSIALAARGSVRIETLTGIPISDFSEAVAQ
jgi:uncharacterized protein with GYD domain